MTLAKVMKKVSNLIHMDSSSIQIAFGVVFGMFFGLIPGIIFKTIIYILIVFLRVNLASALISAVLFYFVGIMFTPLLDRIGFYVLNFNSFIPFWTSLYNTPIIVLSGFNNTRVSGGIVSCLILAIPVFFMSRGVLLYYKRYLEEKVVKWGIKNSLK